MFKLFINKLCIIAISGMMSLSAAAADDSFRLGFCMDNVVGWDSGGAGDTQGSAVYIPATTMGLLKGDSITELSFVIGRGGDVDMKLFITTDLKKPVPDYVQDVSDFKVSKWNTIALDSAFHIDGEAIYIGYTVKMDGYFVSYTEQYEEGEEYKLVDGEWVLREDYISTALYATVKGDNLPHTYANVEFSKMFLFTDTSTPLTLTGVFKNRGIDTINAVRIDCMDNGVKTGSIDIEGLDVHPRDYSSFTVSTPLLAEGDHNIVFSVAQINGKDNLDTITGQTREYAVKSSDGFVKRNLLVEMFSTELCPNCPNGHVYMDQAIASSRHKDNIIEFTHHSGFYSDKFTIKASKDYEWFYATQMTYAPAFMMDRTSLAANNPDLYDFPGSPIAGVSRLRIGDMIEEAMNVPAYSTVNLALDEFTSSGNLTIHVSGKQLLEPEGDSPRLFIFLTEDSIHTTTQSGGGKHYVHQGVPRICVTDTWGDAVSLKDGFDKTYTVAVPDTLKPENMHVIAFVGNMDRERQNNCRVYNSAVQDIKSVMSGIAAVPSDSGLAYSFSGGVLTLSAPCIGISVYSADGRQQMLGSDLSCLDMSGLPGGMYIVKVRDNAGVRSIKVMR